MFRDGKIHIPVRLFALPFIGVFQMLRLTVLGIRAVLTFAFLATGVGTVVAGFTGGLGRKYTVLDYEKKSDANNSGMFGRIKTEERPGWAARFLGVRVRYNEYFGKYVEEGYQQYSYYTPDHQAISDSKRIRIKGALEAYNVMKNFFAA